MSQLVATNAEKFRVAALLTVGLYSATTEEVAVIWAVILQNQDGGIIYIHGFRTEAAAQQAFHTVLVANWPKEVLVMPTDDAKAAIIFNRLRPDTRVSLRQIIVDD